MKHDLPALKKMVEDRLLEEGGLYQLEDIVASVQAGEMQSFSLNDSWVVTKIGLYPRKTVLTVVFAAGDEHELEQLHHEVYDFAVHIGADLIKAGNARDGWVRYAKKHGWKRTGSSFLKDVNDGW